MQCFVNFVAKIWSEKFNCSTIRSNGKNESTKRTKWTNEKKKWKTKLFKCVFYCFSVLVHRSSNSKLFDLFIFHSSYKNISTEYASKMGFLSGCTFCSLSFAFSLPLSLSRFCYRFCFSFAFILFWRTRSMLNQKAIWYSVQCSLCISVFISLRL